MHNNYTMSVFTCQEEFFGNLKKYQKTLDNANSLRYNTPQETDEEV